MSLKHWHVWYRNLCKALDGAEDNQIYQSLDPSRTVFLTPLRKRLPFECAGHWKKVSNQRVLFGPRRKISSAPSHPIHDKDSQSAKNKVEQSECHLWESVELSVRMIINLIIPSLNVTWLGIVLGRYYIQYGLKDGRSMNLVSWPLPQQLEKIDLIRTVLGSPVHTSPYGEK